MAKAKKKDPRGRKEIEDKKVTICIYPRSSTVEALGGKAKVQEIAAAAVEKALNK